jgi:hypothetical protein
MESKRQAALPYVTVTRKIALNGRALGDLTLDISTASVAQGIAAAQRRFF